MLLFSTRTGTLWATGEVVVVGAALVVVGAALGSSASEVGAGAGASVATGAWDEVEVGAASACESSVSALDNDIAPRPPNTMASAINTIANARNGGPPEVGFGLLTLRSLVAYQTRMPASPG
ncbi:hypothetical protein GCM10023318_16690 [Nocardia callitridis]|uniref:Uncharacterized protein n=1 Tax=Nocardia callitridis TaxID=648753 RepID=A0ABP9K2K8_9NOCA